MTNEPTDGGCKCPPGTVHHCPKCCSVCKEQREKQAEWLAGRSAPEADTGHTASSNPDTPAATSNESRGQGSPRRRCGAGVIIKVPGLDMEEYCCELEDGHGAQFPGYGNDDHKEGDVTWSTY